ncbi:MAG: adenylyltransferase/cytidyltransferase family protein [Myxococcota bacterium]|nr:D-glycero-beta-D-manno-heptose 1-phosphate adenylyltransferase [Myxococcales bacterium]MEC7750987.1 adenylyltransferase/cytidyltransferase family protein [Myxococcota bacterium]
MTKLQRLESLGDLGRRLREEEKILVLANGAFDLLHVGHLRYLQGAAAAGDYLLVAVNSDASVRRAKGANRPVVPEAERAELVAGLGCVDAVIIFDEDRPDVVIRAFRPHVQAKGTDYRADEVPEAELMASIGGNVVIVGDPKDHSTTALVQRLGK